MQQAISTFAEDPRRFSLTPTLKLDWVDAIFRGCLTDRYRDGATRLRFTAFDAPANLRRASGVVQLPLPADDRILCTYIDAASSLSDASLNRMLRENWRFTPVRDCVLRKFQAATPRNAKRNLLSDQTLIWKQDGDETLCLQRNIANYSSKG